MADIAQHSVLLPMIEDHLDAAAFTSHLWERALVSPLCGIGRVAVDQERRLLSSLEGLGLGGAVTTEQVLMPALDDEDPRRAFAGALALLERDGTDAVSEIGKRLEDPKKRATAMRALGLSANGEIEGLLRRMVGQRTSSLAPALEVLAFRGARLGPEIGDLLCETDPAVLAAALLAARASGKGPGGGVSRLRINAALESSEAAVRDAGIELGLMHGMQSAWAASRKAVESGALGNGTAALVLAMSGESSDLNLLLSALANKDHRAAVLFALGFCGRAEAAQACLEHMKDPKAARIAGEAFSAITGLELRGELCVEEDRKRKKLVPLEEDDLDANLVPGPEKDLPVPNVAGVEQWWSKNRTRFNPALRYVNGLALNGSALIEAFRSATMRRRHALAFEIAVRTRGEVRIETRTWAKLQLAVDARLGDAASAAVMLPFGELLN